MHNEHINNQQLQHTMNVLTIYKSCNSYHAWIVCQQARTIVLKMSTLKLLISCATLTIQSKPLKEWRCSTRSRSHTNFFVENYKHSLCALQWKKIFVNKIETHPHKTPRNYTGEYRGPLFLFFQSSKRRLMEGKS